MWTEIWPQPVLDLLATGKDHPVFEDGDRVVTAAEMAGLVRRIATGLRAAGVRPGAGVALQLGVTAEAFAAIIAAFAIGARVSGIRPGLTPAQLGHLLGSDDALVVDDARVAERLLRAAVATQPDQVGLWDARGKLLERQGPRRPWHAVLDPGQSFCSAVDVTNTINPPGRTFVIAFAKK